jgi:hypothetical protein
MSRELVFATDDYSFNVLCGRGQRERVQEDLAEWVKEGRKKRRVKGGGRSREGEDTNV